MSTDRDVERIVRSWMDEGVTALPDRVLDLVLDQLPATPQRRSAWPAWRLQAMNSALRIGLVAAALLVVAFLGYRFLGREEFGGPPSSTPTPAPSSAATADPSVGGNLAAGTYTTTNFRPALTYTVPAGWSLMSDTPTAFAVAPTASNSVLGVCRDVRAGDATAQAVPASARAPRNFRPGSRRGPTWV